MTLTFLFTDLERSTQLWERYPAAMRDALRRHDAILRTAVEGAAGRVVKTTGDGMMAVFDSAAGAIAAALAAQLAMSAGSWGETGGLKVRMGIHTGQPEQREGDYFGPTVNRTARIMAAGHGGQVLISESAAALSRDALPAGSTLTDLGIHHLKDLGRPERLYQLTHPGLGTLFPALASARSATDDLPAIPAGLVGRTRELAAIRELLADPSVRLLTLTGPGGTGKTTLAVQVARDLAPTTSRGIAFAEMAAARDVQAVLISLMRALRVGEVPDRPSQDVLVDHLRDRQVLLVLDNLEQVGEAAAVVARLLAECPGLTILATSREALHLRLEHRFPVPPLDLPPPGRAVPLERIGASEAVQLFVDRARAVRPEFVLTHDDAPIVAEICRRLDGLPLAIELAAANLRLFSPQALLDRLGNRLEMLRDGPRDLPERQRTMRATVDWSYQLLAPDDQRLFELMAVFAAPTVDAVAAVTLSMHATDPVPIDVFDGLARLAEKHLVRVLHPPGGEPRVTMLETIREFATEQLEARPDDLRHRARSAHAVHFAGLAERLRAGLDGRQREDSLSALAADAGNLRLAWSFWLGERDLERLEALAGPLLTLDDAHGSYLDTVRLTEDLLGILASLPRAAGPTNREIALRITLARALMTTKGFTPEVEAAFADTLQPFERGTDPHQQYALLRGLASLHLFQARLDESGRLGGQILALGEREDDAGMRIDGHLLQGTTRMFQGDLRAGLDQFERAIALFPDPPRRLRMGRIGTDPRVACLTTSAIALWLLGMADRAAVRADAAIVLAAQLEHPFTSAYARFHAGLLHLWRGDVQAALELATGLVELAEAHELRIWVAAGGCLLGAAQVEQGIADVGLTNLREGIERYGALRSPPVFWPYLLYLDARAKIRAGRPAAAAAPLDRAIDIMAGATGVPLLPEFQLLKGDLVAALGTEEGGGGHGEATVWYQRAADGAQALEVRTSLLRATTRMARAGGDVGAAGAASLREVLASFSEGLDTPDVVEARRTLEGMDGA